LLGMSAQALAQLEQERVIARTPAFPLGRPTRLDLLTKQQAGSIDPDYLDELTKHYGVAVGGVQLNSAKSGSIRSCRRGKS